MHPELLSLSLFFFVTSCSPGPNNIVASHSGFNHGVKKNEKARKPSLVVKVDFGKEIGIKQSSAQITHYYNAESLVGRQVIGVCNFPTKNIAGVVSEVLILGAIEKDGKVVLVHPSQKTDNGLDIA